MPPKKKTTARTKKTSRKSASDPAMMEATTPEMTYPPTSNGSKSQTRWFALGILAVGLVGLLWLNKSWILAAVVDGKPIFRWDLNRVMTSRFGEQTLEGMISEVLIDNAAAEAGVTVTSEEVTAREEQIVQSLGADVTIDELLQYQGMSKEDFDKQIRTQLLVEKILGKDISISEEDVANFIATNSAQLVATEEAAMREEARQVLLDTEIGKRVQQWFGDLKENATIMRYL